MTMSKEVIEARHSKPTFDDYASGRANPTGTSAEAYGHRGQDTPGLEFTEEAEQAAAEYDPAYGQELNQSGIQPLEYKCLVKLDEFKNTTDSGIVISTGDESEREAMAQVKGTLVAIGHNAFVDWNWAPPVGSRVMISKHEGIICRGADQKESELGRYRLVQDKQIAAVLVEE